MNLSKHILTLTLVLLCCLVAVGQATVSIEDTRWVFDETDNGATEAFCVGNEFAIMLPENPTTGHLWDLSVSNGLEIIDTDYLADDNPDGLEGVGGTHWWIIKATKPGEQRITAYHRSWWPECLSSPDYSLTIHVVDLAPFIKKPTDLKPRWTESPRPIGDPIRPPIYLGES